MTYTGGTLEERWHLALEDAPDAALPLLTAVHTRAGLGDGLITASMVLGHVWATGSGDEARAVLAAVGWPPALLDLLPPPVVRAALDAPTLGGSAEITGQETVTVEPESTSATPTLRMAPTPERTFTAVPAAVVEASWASEIPNSDPSLASAPPPPLAAAAGVHDVTALEVPQPPATDVSSASMAEHTNPDDAPPAPGRMDAQGRIFGERHERPLPAGSLELAELLESMAAALEEGSPWPEGMRTTAAHALLLDRLEESVAAGLGGDTAEHAPQLQGIRLRVGACAVASQVARRDANPDIRLRASQMLVALIAGEPRRSVRAALAANLVAWPELPEEVGEGLLATVAELMPVAPPYEGWESVRPATEPLLVRHVVYAPEHRQVRDGYEAAGYVRQSERPLRYLKEVPGGRTVRVELRRAPAAVVMAQDIRQEEVLILSGLALAVETAPPTVPRVVLAAFRRDPFGVPRLADRFPHDHVVGAVRGDKPLDDVGFFHAFLAALAGREPYALVRNKVTEAAPLLARRALWPHEPGALRGAGGAPAPFSTDPSALLEHRISWALPRASRRPFDLKWRNDTPDTTSYLALEVAAALAGTPLQGEDLPVVEPGGFHEGLPDVDVQAGSALWRVSITRGLCSQAEEGLAALVTLYVHARRAELLGEKPRTALLLGAVAAAQIVSLHAASRDAAHNVMGAVLRHAGMPPQLVLDHLVAAGTRPESLAALRFAHARWLAD